MAAQPGSAPVPQLLHGVPGGRADAGPPHQEGPAGAPEDGGQLPPVSPGLWSSLACTWSREGGDLRDSPLSWAALDGFSRLDSLP